MNGSVGLGDDTESLISGESERSAPALRTYDVFDTAITRLVGQPTSVFLLLGHSLVGRGLWRGTGEQFAAARVAAETRARVHAAGREIQFAAIYRELAFAYTLSGDAADEIAREELRLERQLIRAVPSTLSALERERLAGCCHAFVSDMYLPNAVIHSWLHELGVARAGDRLWVSSEVGQTKSDGTLFDAVALELSGQPSRWVHTGDNPWSDVQMPRSRGIAAVSFTDCHLTRYELSMEAFSGETAGLSSLLAGAARWTRLSLKEADADQRVLNEYAAQVAGPAVYAFVLWVLRTAQRHQIRRLWFMARDGQVMLPIARTIAARLGIDIELGYLYGGRQVVKVAALREIDDAAIDWMTGGAGFMTVAEVLERVGVVAGEVLQVVRSFGLPEKGPIGWERVPKLRDFLRHPEVASRVLAVAAERRSDVLEYFRQCGLIDGESCCVVDLGWRGTVLKAIAELVGRTEAERHLYLYFGLYARPPECAGLRMIGYLFDVDGTRRLGTGHDIKALTAVMETFCQADHGQVMKLARTVEGFVPACREETPTSDEKWNVPFFQRQLATFADAVLVDACRDPDADLRGLVGSLLQQGLEQPTLEQARVLGSILFVDDQAGGAAQPFAHAYGLRDLRTAFRQGDRPRYGLNWWTEGAWKMTPRLMRLAVRLAGKLGRIRSRHSPRPN